MPVHIRLELNLLDNSFDYLSASLEYIAKARQDRSKVSWKFAILNLVFAIELLLKERLRQENYLLIYADIDRYKTISRETKTVSWSVLLERLKFVIGADFDQINSGRLSLAQQLRNQMLHYDVQLDFPAVYHDFANLLNFYTQFFNAEVRQDEEDTLHKHVPEKLWQQNEDLSEAFVEEVVFYNGVFMSVDLKKEIVEEQVKTKFLISGNVYQRIPYVLSPNNPARSDYLEDRKCHDCWVVPGQIHLLGCDMEVCPKCGTQLLSCGCEYSYPV
jgi:hypothetical protein